MKIGEIRKLTNEELTTELERLHRRIFDLHAQAVTQKLEDPSMITKAKRDIARALTVIREREMQSRRAAEETQPQQSQST
jgi:large subunit ribosomal protein L29